MLRRVLVAIVALTLAAALIGAALWPLRAQAQSLVVMTQGDPQALTITPIDACGQPALPGAPMVDYTSKTPAACVSPTAWTLRGNAQGLTVWRYCQAADGYRFQMYALICPGCASVPNSLPAAVAAVAALGEAGIAAAASKVTLPLTDPALARVWCQWRDEIRAGVPQQVGAAAWVSSGPAAFTVKGGTLSQPSYTLKAGAACDCSSSIVIGSSRYCTYAGAAAANVMTKCVKGTP